MNVAIFTLFLLLEGCFLCGFFLLGMVSFRKRKKRRYDFLTHFPFEMGESLRLSDYLSRLFLAAYELLSVAAVFYLLYARIALPSVSGRLITLAIFFFLRGAAALGMIFVPAYAYKPHLCLVVGHMAFALISTLSTAFFLRDLGLASNQVYGNAFMIACCVLVLAEALLMLNPFLARWSKLKAEMDEDGTITTKRPRPFVLAATEWASLFIDMATSLLWLLGCFVFTLL